MSNTVINTNMSALNSHRAMLGVGNRQRQSSERLSTGMRINRAADDAAGLAISEKMRNQIRGLDQAVRNSQDGVSLIQTAEGAMEEIHRILERVRELTLQASSDTNTSEDRRQTLQEVSEILAQVTDIAARTEFNTQPLLGGGSPANVTPTPPPGPVAVPGPGYTLNAFPNFSFTGDNPTLGALLEGLQLAQSSEMSDVLDLFSTAINNLTGGSVQAWLSSGGDNGTDLYAEGIETLEDLFTLDYSSYTAAGLSNQDALDDAIELRNALLTALNSVDLSTHVVSSPVAPGIAPLSTDNVDMLTGVSFTGDNFAATGVASGYSLTENSTITQVNAAVNSAISVLVNNDVTDWLETYAAYDLTNFGINDLEALFNFDYYDLAAWNAGTGTSQTQTEFDAIIGARNALLDAINDADLSDYIEADPANGNGNGNGGNGYLQLQFQTGANAGQRMTIRIGAMTLEALGLNEFVDDFEEYAENEDISAGGIGLSALVTTLDTAITRVSTQRATLGAFQNRLDHNINNLQVSSENLSAANSRIRDTDMAAEMMRFTQSNVLQQAAMSMLAQANMAPQSILQLLG